MPESDFQISDGNLASIIESTLSDDFAMTKDARTVGVLHLDSYKSCLHCTARVGPLSPPKGMCTNKEWTMVLLYDLFQEKIMLRHDSASQ